MSEVLTFEELKAAVSDGSVDTVLVCLVDMQGRLMGKRFVARHFVDSAWEENALLRLSAGNRLGDGHAGRLRLDQLAKRLWRLCHETGFEHVAARTLA